MVVGCVWLCVLHVSCVLCMFMLCVLYVFGVEVLWRCGLWFRCFGCGVVVVGRGFLNAGCVCVCCECLVLWDVTGLWSCCGLWVLFVWCIVGCGVFVVAVLWFGWRGGRRERGRTKVESNRNKIRIKVHGMIHTLVRATSISITHLAQTAQ